MARFWVERAYVIIGWLAIWQIVAQALLLNPSYKILVATPLQVALAFVSFISGSSGLHAVNENIFLSIYELLLAFGIAASLGLSTGMVIGQVRMVGEVLEPLIVAFLAVPNYVLFPIMFLLFSVGPRSDIAFGAYLGFFPIVANTVAGIRSVDRQLIILGRSMGASKSAIFRKIIIPASAATIISGLKQGFSLSLIGVVAGELLAPISGIGLLITEAIGFFYIDRVYALVILVVLIAVSGNYLLSRLESRFII